MKAIIGSSFLAFSIATAGAAAQEIATGEGAILRALDRVSGAVRDLDLNSGEATLVGHLNVTLHECRYKVEDPAADAYALISIADEVTGEMKFQGWMLAASPALNALDHPRYDVWVLRCKTSSAATDGG